MTAVTPKQIRRLATNPADHIKFLTTGKLPRGTEPEGPLVDLMKQINPRDRAAIVGLKVGPELGYQGSRTFHTAEQAFRWIHPADEVFDAFPADSWRIKRPGPRLTIEDLVAQATKVPEGLVERYPRLRRPVPHKPAVDSDLGEPEQRPATKLRP